MSDQKLISTSCPNCNKTFELPEQHLGNKGRCDACQTKFIIEETPVASPTPQPEQTKEATETHDQTPASTGSSKGKVLAVFALLLVVAGIVGYQEFGSKLIPTDDSSDSEKSVNSNSSTASDSSSTSTSASGNNKAQPKPLIPVVDQLKPLDVSFPVKKSFSQIDIRQYRKTYPEVYQGWWPKGADQTDAAKKCGHYLGPLGVRVRAHVPQYQNRPCFPKILPHAIRTHADELGLIAAEVASIAPGSPAEGNLQVGDLIIGIEGELLKSGSEYRPGWDFMHKDRREIQLMLGEKIDLAQGRGDVRLTVLRYPQEKKVVFEQSFSGNSDRVSSPKIAVEPGDEIHLHVLSDGSNAKDHFAWLSPQFYGRSVPLQAADQNKIKPDSATTGWGKISYTKDLTGKPLGEKGIAVHANSKIIFTVPRGYRSFDTSMAKTNAKGKLTAQIEVVKQPQKLPVYKDLLWKGKGGNKSIGVQQFDIEIPSDGYLTLESNKFDGSIGGDGCHWMDITLEGDYGTKQLFDLPWKSANAGYGRAQIINDKPNTYNKYTCQSVLHLHAQGTAVWKLPAGTKRVKGVFSAGSYGKVQPLIHHTNEALPLTGIHKSKVVNLRFPIGKAGSYSSTYPKNCKKSELTATRHTTWLAAQQREDGSWPRLSGYTSSGWDTAWCGLALMSSGDAKYDTQIKKAAHYIAFNSPPSDWIADRAMRLMFLSEYYLRYQDAKILGGIQAAYHQVVACCKTDFMAGHKVNGFGYGIAGQHYCTGHMALSLALAARTPIEIDKTLVDGVIRHAGEVCVNGTYAYGRGRRMARDSSRKYGGGNAMVGPGVLGIIIGGGHSFSIKEAAERWDASIGDGDNSHATSSLAFIFSSLAMAAANEEVYLKHMQNFKYKMAIDDNWEGGFLKSAFPLDLQGGEGVTTNWIRSAGSILVLNALKKNMAMTGKKEFYNPNRLSGTPVSEWGGQVHSYYLRNWCIAQELLGKHAPKDIRKGIDKLKNHPRTLELVPLTKATVLKLAPSIIKQISGNSQLSPRKKAYAIELLCGLDFKIYTELKGDKQQVSVTVNQPLHQLNWLDSEKQILFENSPFPLKADINITGKNIDKPIELKIQDHSKFNLDQGTRGYRFTRKLKQPSQKEFRGAAQISFSIGDTKVSYTRPLFFNQVLAYSKNANLRRVQLKLKMAPRAYYQSQPLMIAGIAFDCMYPKERMVDFRSPKGTTVSIHEGDTVIVDLASDNLVCAWVHSLTFVKKTQVRTATPKSQRNIVGDIKGDLNDLIDFSTDTGCDFHPENRKNIIEYDFGKKVTLNGLDVHNRHTSFIRIWYYNGTKWLPLIWDSYTPNTSFHPTFPDTSAQLWRVEVHNHRPRNYKTFRFYYNPNRINKPKAAPHTTQPKFHPPITIE